MLPGVSPRARGARGLRKVAALVSRGMVLGGQDAAPSRLLGDGGAWTPVILAEKAALEIGITVSGEICE